MKKAFKSAVSVILSLMIVFSALFSATAFSLESESDDGAALLEKAMKYCEETDATEETEDSEYFETQSLAVYDYLTEYLLESGRYDSEGGIYYIIGTTTANGVYMEFIIYYREATEKIYFFSDITEGKLYLYMVISPSDTDSYDVHGYIPSLDYSMDGTVYPRSYPHYIELTSEPNIYLGPDGIQLWKNLANQDFQLTLPYWNALLERDTSLNLGNFGFARLFTPKPAPAKKFYVVSFDANGGTSKIPSQNKEKKVNLTLTNSIPQRYGYKFLGWSTDKNATEPEYYPGGLFTVDQNTTLYAVWERDESVIFYDSTVRIVNNPGSVTLNYKTVVYISAEAQNMPEGAYIKWFKNGQDTGITDSQISFEGTGNVKLSVKAFDKDGNVLRDANGKEIADTEEIIVNNGFFHRLIQAIRRLFFGVTTYQQ